ncbi:MAG: NFACT family protein, partial [Tenericutes bacterium]|nr:NFACT family protein [Mycoplasmatota bacterium]
MSIDGRFIKFLAEEIHNELKNGRIQRISQLAKTDFLFVLRANNKNRKLYFSLSTSLARINITNKDYPNDYIPGGFCMFLRKHFEGGIVRNIEALNDDRIIRFEIENKNDIGDKTTLFIIVEMFSRYTNMILLDDNKKVINAYKHISPFDSSDRTIINGVTYTLPEDTRYTQDDLTNIKKLFETEVTSKDMVSSIKGISPLLANYIIKKSDFNHHKMFDIYSDMLTQVAKPTLALNQKTEFYYFDMFSSNQKYFSTLSELIDNYFLEASSIERVKQVYKYISVFTKQELKRKKNKLEKLHADLDKALNNNILRIKGDMLITYQHEISKGDASYDGYSYELEKNIDIELNRLLDPIQNANKYYTKYKKQKKAVNHIKKQIRLTIDMIEYLDGVYNQISNTYSLPDLLEIQDELKQNGFLSRKKTISKKKKPNFSTYYDENDITILVGKNNIQNNYLTHKYAKKDYWWFHTKNQTGSHVIVSSIDELSESTIRTAANLSACYSKAKNSSSVPVDYTKIRYIKKVPGKLGSYVTYTNQKTIYID